MKVIIAGSRPPKEFNCIQLDRWEQKMMAELEKAVAEAKKLYGIEITEVISGKARGIDTIGEYWAAKHDIPVIPMPADWHPEWKKGQLDRGAGFRRNARMADVGEALIDLWDGESRGSKNMIEIAIKKCIRVHVHMITHDLPAVEELDRFDSDCPF